MYDISDHTAAWPHSTFLQFHSPEDERVRYSVTCYPARQNGKIRDWNLSQLKESGPFLSEVRKYVPPEVRQLYAPTVNKMSGEMLPPERFTRRFDYGRELHVHRPGYLNGSPELQRCDGTLIRRKTGFLMSPAGCALIVLTGVTPDGREICLMAHAGRNCLIDKPFILIGEKSRKHFSIVDAMVAFAEERGLRKEDMTLRSFFSIHWRAFEHSLSHPEFGHDNKLMVEYFDRHPHLASALMSWDDSLFLCQSTLIRKEAEVYPLRLVETDIHTLPINDEYAYTRHSDPALGGTVRNLVLGFHH